MQSMKNCFEEYGADYTGTMERFMQNEALYVRLLGKLFPSVELRQLGETLMTGNQADAFDAAHTLKGVAGNLGLTPLYEAVCAIVEPLRAKEKRADYPALFDAVQKEFMKAEAFWNALKGGE
ncbi:Hpt domain-containing protein [Bittarella massiliensis (ex Durand et al. 2017)]|uniref:Hpt domain-containing protein n=1 Tax=Bittarella massiliensis (ex Durand et al. 2017) TaxID=1720313 RepID=UPI001AA11CB8|nr:Hpt domain-containing protein [Bittarella massiliensis (ex Durand et al. 2017)]MBO1678513.1 Hpt domain-containing protein [Bittarella massiliensis (ex Durand et al. 2017)]